MLEEFASVLKEHFVDFSDACWQVLLLDLPDTDRSAQVADQYDA